MRLEPLHPAAWREINANGNYGDGVFVEAAQNKPRRKRLGLCTSEVDFRPHFIF